MIRETVMFGRAIPSDAIEAIYDEHLQVDIAGANVCQDWYPRYLETTLLRPRPSREATYADGRAQDI